MAREKFEYEVLWYDDTEQKFEHYETKSFKSAKAAMNYYNKHKDDAGKYGWWVTKRDEDGVVIDDLVY